MKNYFLLLLLAIPFLGKSQRKFEDTLYNAFQVTKMAKAYEAKIIQNSTLSDTDKTHIKSILSSIIWYANLQDANAPIQVSEVFNYLKNYTSLYNCYSTLYYKILNIDKFFSVRNEEISIFFSANQFTSRVETNNVKDKIENLNRYKDAKKTSEKNYLDSQLILHDLKNIIFKDSILLKSYRDSSAEISGYHLPPGIDTSTNITRLGGNQTARNYTENRLPILKHNDSSASTSYDSVRLAFQKYLTNPNLPDAIKNFVNSVSGLTPNTLGQTNVDVQIAAAVSQIQTVKETIVLESSTITPSFRLPSQSEIIDALAIYLAKRVKQEAVMWFFENIQRNAKQYDLIKTFFPNTITLLLSNEVYEIPNMGAQWRYALSKDFVTMPRNLLYSNWFKSLLKTEKPENKRLYEYLKTTVDIGELLNQRYNYRELVKHMHLKLSSISVTDSSSGVNPGDIFNMLYAFNQECFTQTNKTDSFRLIRYEDLRGMSKDDLEIAASLMDLKYGHALKNFWRKNVSSFSFSKEEAEQFRRWLGSIETGITQFQKIQQDYLKLIAATKDLQTADAVYSSFNVWENIIGLFKALIPDSTLAPVVMQNLSTDFEKIKTYVEQALEMYHQLSIKNYAGAVNTGIALAEELAYRSKDSVFIITRLQADSILQLAGKANLKIFTNAKSEPLKLYTSDLSALKAKIDSSTTTGITDNELIKLRASSLQILKDMNVDASKSRFLPKGNSNDRTFIIKQFTDSIQKVSDSLKYYSFHKTDQRAALFFSQDRTSVKVIRRFAGLLNDVILTKDSKQLAKVIESNALPTGSYKRKRNSWWSLDVNAYVGGYIGTERAKSRIEKIPNSSAGVLGITAPIGFTLSKTWGKRMEPDEKLEEDMIRNPDKIRIGEKRIWKRTRHTLSLSLNLIDIGAVVSYRFTNTKDSVLPQKANWSQVFSPGLQLNYGIPNAPLVIGGGIQYTPRLRRISDATVSDELSQFNAFRASVHILFDLPLFNLWQRTYWSPRTKK